MIVLILSAVVSGIFAAGIFALIFLFIFLVRSLKKEMIGEYFYTAKPNLFDLALSRKYGRNAVAIHFLPKRINEKSITDIQRKLAKDFRLVRKYTGYDAPRGQIFITTTTEVFVEQICRFKPLEVLYIKSRGVNLMEKTVLKSEIKKVYGKEKAAQIELPKTMSTIVFRQYSDRGERKKL